MYWCAEHCGVVLVAGYEHPVDQVVEDLLSCLDDPALALLQWNEAFGVVQVRRQSKHLRCLRPAACSSSTVRLVTACSGLHSQLAQADVMRAARHAITQLQALQQMLCPQQQCG